MAAKKASLPASRARPGVSTGVASAASGGPSSSTTAAARSAAVVARDSAGRRRHGPVGEGRAMASHTGGLRDEDAGTATGGRKRKKANEVTANGSKRPPYNAGSHRARAHRRCQTPEDARQSLTMHETSGTNATFSVGGVPGAGDDQHGDTADEHHSLRAPRPPPPVSRPPSRERGRVGRRASGLCRRNSAWAASTGQGRPRSRVARPGGLSRPAAWPSAATAWWRVLQSANGEAGASRTR